MLVWPYSFWERKDKSKLFNFYKKAKLSYLLAKSTGNWPQNA